MNTTLNIRPQRSALLSFTTKAMVSYSAGSAHTLGPSPRSKPNFSVFWRELVSINAVSLSFVNSGKAITDNPVFVLGFGLQMCWVAASSIFAQVVHFYSTLLSHRQWFYKPRVNKTGDDYALPTPFEVPVTCWVFTGNPDPTTVRCNANFAKKPGHISGRKVRYGELFHSNILSLGAT